MYFLSKWNSRVAGAVTLAMATATFAGTAHAHPGHGTNGFVHGIMHPIGGWDHVLAMIAVGLWATQLATENKRAIWMVPGAFLSIMMLGGLLSISGLQLPLVEAGIAASVLILGVLIAAAVRLPLVASVGIVGCFSLFHGFAHGAEMPSTTSGLAYGAGFVAATVLLHAAGIGGGLLIQRVQHSTQATALRFAGAAIALGGVLIALPKFSG